MKKNRKGRTSICSRKFATYFANNRKYITYWWLDICYAGLTKNIADRYSIQYINRIIKKYLLGQISGNQNKELAEILNSQR